MPDSPTATPHHLRHTFRSLLRLVGADHTLAKELLRHSSDAMSDYYSHTHEREGRAAADRIEALVAGAVDEGTNFAYIHPPD